VFNCDQNCDHTRCTRDLHDQYGLLEPEIRGVSGLAGSGGSVTASGMAGNVLAPEASLFAPSVAGGVIPEGGFGKSLAGAGVTAGILGASFGVSFGVTFGISFGRLAGGFLEASFGMSLGKLAGGVGAGVTGAIAGE